MKRKDLLATNFLYKPLGYESFDAVKKSFFEQQSDYYTKTSKERWMWLKKAFCDAIPQPDIQSTLSTFMDARQQESTENKYVLSPEKCFDYIERFYFLYQNDDHVFRLSSDTKASFLALMREAITNDALCETGRFMRFEQLIMEFRADKNWIDNILQKSRYSVMVALHEAYNRAEHIPRSMHVHTLGVMQRLAHEKKLGIAQLHDLHDVHTSSSYERCIKTYFEQHYIDHFDYYENNAIEILSDHVLSKISTLLHENQVDISLWQVNGVVLPNGYKIQLMPNHRKLTLAEMEKDIIYLYLQEVYLKGEQIWGVTHCGEPFPIIEALKQIGHGSKSAVFSGHWA